MYMKKNGNIYTPIKGKRKYNRTKITKGERKAVHRLIKYFLVILTVVLAIHTSATSKNTYTVEFKEVIEERLIFVEKIEAEELTVEEQIRAIAKEKNFRWENYLVRLARCESTLDPLATNDKNNYPKDSVDRGLFMINDYWHAEVSNDCAFDVRCSTEFAIDLINAGRQSEFVCDRLIN